MHQERVTLLYLNQVTLCVLQLSLLLEVIYYVSDVVYTGY